MSCFSPNFCLLILVSIHGSDLQQLLLVCFFFFKGIPLFFLFFFFFLNFWLCWVFVSVKGLSPAAASGGHSSSRCAGLLLSRPLLLQSTSSRCAGSVVVAHRPSRSAACGIFPDQGSNPCPLHWQTDSQPLRHQGSPYWCVLMLILLSLHSFCTRQTADILQVQFQTTGIKQMSK